MTVSVGIWDFPLAEAILWIAINSGDDFEVGHYKRVGGRMRWHQGKWR